MARWRMLESSSGGGMHSIPRTRPSCRCALPFPVKSERVCALHEVASHMHSEAMHPYLLLSMLLIYSPTNPAQGLQAIISEQ